MNIDFGELGAPGADFDAYQLECAAAALAFRRDDEILRERESIERAMKMVRDRLARLSKEETASHG